MSEGPRYLTVAVPTPLRRAFSYLPPAGFVGRLSPGTRLKVPFGRRSIVGVLLGTSESADVAHGKVRAAQEVLDDSPALPSPLMKLCTWAADYYHHPVGDVMATALPVLLRQGASLDGREEILVAGPRADADMESLVRAPRQHALLRRLRTVSEGLTRADLRREDFDPRVVRALLDKDLAAWHTKPGAGLEPFDATLASSRSGDITPSAEQLDAIDTIGRKVGTTLLHGITGSGKTEVYLRVIADQLRAGRQALVLVPEIGLTPQTVGRFAERFNVPVVAMHSGLTDRERLDAWRAARTGAAGIVIGTRSAIFTPLANPGLIVVDEEHDASFKQQEGFRYNARDLAVMRGQLERIPVVLGSATPSLETWHNARSGKYAIATLRTRPKGASPAEYRVINIRNQVLNEGFAQELLDAIGLHLARGNQVLVFLNRRGFSPVLLCRHCGFIARCHRCDARMTLHAASGQLICHHCGSQARAYRQCPECHGEDLVPLGAGTQRIESTLTALFPGNAVMRIDRDSTRSKGALAKFMTRITSGEPAILVGTQLLAKGHHFPDVTLVAIVDMDGGFYSSDYKATERMAQLILQVGGRSGRASKPGIVAIQTHFPDQPIFRTLIDQGYATFADKLLEERKEYELPPFHHQVLVRAESSTRELPLRFLENLRARTRPLPSVDLLGPVPSAMERRAGKFRAQLLLSSKNRKPLRDSVDALIAAAEQSTLARRVRWSVDVDPVDLF